VTLHQDLASFIDSRSPGARGEALWGGRTHLRIVDYLSSETPPLTYITSVRCVLLRGRQILVQRDIDSTHILPGGRREPGETLEETLRREVLEETGWTLTDPRILGFRLFHNLSPKLPMHPYPYPHFVQVVYFARAGYWSLERKLDDGYEVDTTFYSVEQVRKLPLTAGERLFLDAALREGE